MPRPVTTVKDSSTPCWPMACHIAGAVSPAQAMKTRAAPASRAWEAKGARSVALAGTSSGVAGAPPLGGEGGERGRACAQEGRRVGAAAMLARRGGPRRDVGVAEGAVLGDHQHLLAGRVPDERLRGEDVLVGLPAGPEGVGVD